jgi:signal transduction histidine kinase
MFYKSRVKGLAHQFNMRLEERVIERTRIARELHDTLLQSFHGLLFRFSPVSFGNVQSPDAEPVCPKVAG